MPDEELRNFKKTVPRVLEVMIAVVVASLAACGVVSAQEPSFEERDFAIKRRIYGIQHPWEMTSLYADPIVRYDPMPELRLAFERRIIASIPDAFGAKEPVKLSVTIGSASLCPLAVEVAKSSGDKLFDAKVVEIARGMEFTGDDSGEPLTFHATIFKLPAQKVPIQKIKLSLPKGQRKANRT